MHLVNEEIVHSIPRPTGDPERAMVNHRCLCGAEWLAADSAWTFGVGQTTPQAERLLKVTQEALFRGIAQARPGNRTGDIVMRSSAMRNAGFLVVRELHGHGVGRSMHEGELHVPNYGARNKGMLLQCGMTFAIEPMINVGRKEVLSRDDGWTIRHGGWKPIRPFRAYGRHCSEMGAEILTNGE